MIERETTFRLTSSMTGDTVLLKNRKHIMGKIGRLLSPDQIAVQGKAHAQEKQKATSKHREILDVNTTTDTKKRSTQMRSFCRLRPRDQP
jgi:GTP:adenosylcobinamide-phosphate guanylyltransferase